MSYLHDWKKYGEKHPEKVKEYIEAMKAQEYSKCRDIRNEVHKNNPQWRRLE